METTSTAPEYIHFQLDFQTLDLHDLPRIKISTVLVQIASKQKCGIFGIRGFQKAQIGSNERKFSGDGFESHKDRRSWWVFLLVK